MEIESEIWVWNRHQLQTKACQKSQVWASSRYDESLAEFSARIFALLDTLSLPSYSSCFTFTHLLTNESFHLPLKCHSQRGKHAATGESQPSSSLLQTEQKERIKPRLGLEETSRSPRHQDWYLLQPREKGSKDKWACLLWQRLITPHWHKGVMCVKWVLTWVCDSLVTVNFVPRHINRHRQRQADSSMWINP